MNKEERITVYKSNNIFAKIKKFFRNIFYRTKNKEYVSNEVNSKDNYSDFRRELEIQQDEEKLIMLKLQDDYKNGLIEEEDISEEDYQKLLDLYDEQNQQIKEEIERDKIQIKNMLEQLKKKS